MNQRRSDVRLNDGISKSLNLPLCGEGIAASSTTKRPSSIGFPLSFAIFSNVSKALSV